MCPLISDFSNNWLMIWLFRESHFTTFASVTDRENSPFCPVFSSISTLSRFPYSCELVLICTAGLCAFLTYNIRSQKTFPIRSTTATFKIPSGHWLKENFPLLFSSVSCLVTEIIPRVWAIRNKLSVEYAV